jgi:DNA-binding response OmpR family regulator
VSRLLIIDDDEENKEFTAELLRKAGHVVDLATAGTEGLAAALTVDYDLLLLDLSLPDVAGEYVLAALMSVKPDSHVIVVSSVEEIGRRIGCLDAGAADFIAKPFQNAEFLARVRARLREFSRNRKPVAVAAAATVGVVESTVQSPMDPSPPLTDAVPAPPLVELEAPFDFGAKAASSTSNRARFFNVLNPATWQGTGADRIFLDAHRRAIVINGAPIELSQREYVLMSHLLQRRGQVCSREELLLDVWGIGFDPGTNIVDVYVRRLRRKLVDQLIETVRNRGYRLVAG